MHGQLFCQVHSSESGPDPDPGFRGLDGPHEDEDTARGYARSN